MTIQNQHDTICLMSWHQLHAADFSFHQPFFLMLEEGQRLQIDDIVRVIPKRRMVGYGLWEGKPVVIKLFFDALHASKQKEKDASGIKLLHEHHTPAPKLLYEGASHDRRIYVLIFERILNAVSLMDYNDEALLTSTVIEIATQHVFGVLQHDLHLKNFLYKDHIIYTLDGGKVEIQPSLLPKKESLQALAIFLSQLGVGVEKLQKKLFYTYTKARGWLVKSSDITELFFLIKEWNKKRWKNFSKKIYRNSTDFAVIKKNRWSGMYDRKYVGKELLDFFANPEDVFQRESTIILKAGGSNTVIKVVLDEKEYVIKRYNIKHIGHFFRRCLRETRACYAWRLAQKLRLFGVATAKPIAFIENKIMGLRGKSYYITEYVHGEHAGDFFAREKDETKIHDMANHILNLLDSLAKLYITHGDLKISNVLINAKTQPVLIDMDGAIEHYSLTSLKRGRDQDLARFIYDLDKQSLVYHYFKGLTHEFNSRSLLHQRNMATS